MTVHKYTREYYNPKGNSTTVQVKHNYDRTKPRQHPKFCDAIGPGEYLCTERPGHLSEHASHELESGEPIVSWL